MDIDQIRRTFSGIGRRQAVAAFVAAAWTGAIGTAAGQAAMCDAIQRCTAIPCQFA